LTNDDLLWAVRDAVGSDYEVLGEVAHDATGLVYLARERVDQNLRLLRVARTAGEDGGQDEFELEVMSTLDASVPDLESRCGRCGATLRPWARFCTKCGQDVSGVGPSSKAHLSRTGLLEAVREAAADQYEVIGDLPRSEGGGLVYFARERASGRLVALRLQLEGEDEYSLGVTRVLRPVQPTAPSPACRRTVVTRRQAAGRLADPSKPTEAPAATPRRSASRSPGWDRWVVILTALMLIAAALAFLL
jgi:hypothetical protein